MLLDTVFLLNRYRPPSFEGGGLTPCYCSLKYKMRSNIDKDDQFVKIHVENFQGRHFLRKRKPTANNVAKGWWGGGGQGGQVKQGCVGRGV
jgi:hypothetical protein